MKNLTERQLEVVGFIRKFIHDNGYSPSMKEIADRFGFSTKAAFDHITALRKKNVIKSFDGRMSRSITFTEKKTRVLKVPLLGKIAAGTPLFSDECIDGYVSVPSDLAGKQDSRNLFAMRVSGESMIDDGINDGDIAVLIKTSEAENGDIVAASIGDEDNYSVTLKHFYKTAERYELRPANSAYNSFFSNHCNIYGKLLMIIRKY